MDPAPASSPSSPLGNSSGGGCFLLALALPVGALVAALGSMQVAMSILYGDHRSEWDWEVFGGLPALFTGAGGYALALPVLLLGRALLLRWWKPTRRGREGLPTASLLAGIAVAALVGALAGGWLGVWTTRTLSAPRPPPAAHPVPLAAPPR